VDQPALPFPDEKLDTRFLTAAAATPSSELLTDFHSSPSKPTVQTSFERKKETSGDGAAFSLKRS